MIHNIPTPTLRATMSAEEESGELGSSGADSPSSELGATSVAEG